MLIHFAICSTCHFSLINIDIQEYLDCLQVENQHHYKCREYSKKYLTCRMEHQLMAKEDLNQLGFSPETKIESVVEYDKSKEKEGYIAGKHIEKPIKWWFQK